MKKLFFVFLLSAFCFLLCVPTVFCEQIANAHKVSKAPKIDGVLDDECYKTCAYISNFLNLSDSSVGEIKDKVYIAYDDENLYFGIDSVCPKFQATIIDKAGDRVYIDDDIEIYIRPYINSMDYYMVAMNGGNSLYVGQEKSAYWFDNVKYASRRSEKGWTGEICLPIKDMGLSAMPGAMGFNICGAKQREGKLFTWADIYGASFHTPERFGTLLFDESLPIIRVESLQMNEKTLKIKADATDSSDYTVSLGDETKQGRTDRNIDIAETFDRIKGSFRLTFAKDGKVFSQSDFAMCSFNISYKLKGNTVHIITDLSNAMIGPYQKVEIRLEEANKSDIRQDTRIIAGENFAWTDPYIKEYDWKLPHKGDYMLVMEVWSQNGLVKRLEEKIVY